MEHVVRYCAFILTILGIALYLIGAPMNDWLFCLVSAITLRSGLLVYWARS